MFSILKVALLVGVGFLAGQAYTPKTAGAGVVDRVVEELHGIADAVDRVSERLVCKP